MKRLAVKRLHEKVVLAAIILSCGLVMQADPPAGSGKVKTGPVVSHKVQPAQPGASRLHHARNVKEPRARYQEVAR